METSPPASIRQDAQRQQLFRGCVAVAIAAVMVVCVFLFRSTCG